MPCYQANDAFAELSLDLAAAYPDGAGITSSVRQVRLDRGDSVQLADDFTLKTPSSKIVLHFVNPCEVELVRTGQFRLHDGQTGIDLVIGYQPPQLRVERETIELKDDKLAEMWGPQLRRISLHPGTPRKQGIWSAPISPSN